MSPEPPISEATLSKSAILVTTEFTKAILVATVPTSEIFVAVVIIDGRFAALATVLTEPIFDPAAITFAMSVATVLTSEMSAATVLTFPMSVAVAITELIAGATIWAAVVMSLSISERRSRLCFLTAMSLPIPFP